MSQVQTFWVPPWPVTCTFRLSNTHSTCSRALGWTLPLARDRASGRASRVIEHLHTVVIDCPFQRVEGFRAPRWTDPARPQQMHIDVMVTDLDTAEAQVLALDATHPFSFARHRDAVRECAKWRGQGRPRTWVGEAARRKSLQTAHRLAD